MMTTEQLEQRVAALERAMSDVRQKVDLLVGGPDPKSRWWERLPPLPEELRETFDAMTAYGQYFRRTGQSPPPDWKPGDPIPEPDFWK